MEANRWNLDTKDDGTAEQTIKAQAAGQYRLSYDVTDAKGHEIEGGYVFIIRGDGFDGKEFRFNDIEVTTDKKEYAAGEKVKLMVSANRTDGTVLLFVRPSNGVYLAPMVIRLKGKSVVEEVEVGKKDMPNFFVEALTVANAHVYTDVRGDRAAGGSGAECGGDFGRGGVQAGDEGEVDGEADGEKWRAVHGVGGDVAV